MSQATTHAFDLEALLRPVSAERPGGADLSDEGTHDRISAARQEDDASLSQGIYEKELKRADWPGVEALAREALATRTKDLQIAAWLAEAWLHLYGFRGLGSGLRLMAELCERFWEDLYPQPDGDDFEGRVAPVEWVNNKLSHKLKLVPVTAPRAGDVPAYTYADWERAYEHENLLLRDAKAARADEARGRVTQPKFKSSAALTDPEFFVELYADLTLALEACDALEAVLDERCGPDASSLHQFRKTLREIRELAAEVLGVRPRAAAHAPADDGHEEDGEEEYEDDPAAAEVGLWSSGPVRSREDAYRRLAEAADYLMRTEPHSPTPYLVRRAVEWGGMSLQQVLQQIVTNDGEMKELNRLLRLSPGDGR